MRGLSLVAASGGHSSSQCTGPSLSRPLLLWSTGSRCAGSAVVAHGPSCSAAMWDPPRPGLEPVSPELAGRFSTTAPPGKPHVFPFIAFLVITLNYIYITLYTYNYTHMYIQIVTVYWYHILPVSVKYRNLMSLLL